jgi:putative hydrolase of the HAD superfamily
MRFADLEAVTVDGFGTLLELGDPIAPLEEALRKHGVERSPADVRRAFEAEAAHYRVHAHHGRDGETLASLRRECVAVFLGELGAPLAPESFVDAFLASLVFRPAPGSAQALATLRSHGLKLAVVSNWDCSLPAWLDALGLGSDFQVVVTSAEAGIPKPDPRAFGIALERLGVTPERALHVGDEPADEEGAEAAGMHFAPAPLAAAVEALA